MTESRTPPFYCPYCGDEDLRPDADAHGRWRCGSCLRTFEVRLVGTGALR